MNAAQKVSNKCLWWSVFWTFIFAAGLAAFMYWQVGEIKQSLLHYPESQIGTTALEIMNRTLDLLVDVFWKVAATSVVLVWLFIWASYRLTLKGTLREPMELPGVDAPAKDKKETPDMPKRRSLLLLSLLQREGRLVDFLEEDLQAYDDAQIGAAVRSIQESCKKSLNKYLDPRPVIDKEEGEAVTVEDGFDPGAIKLTGNVTGQPPFEGTLQHRGWKAGRFDLPELSGTVNAEIICPAEVEIL
jgi:hypothetical protein